MAKRLTTFSKLLIVLLILAALFFGGQWVMNNTKIGQDLKDKAEQERTEQSNSDRNDSNNSSTSNAESKTSGSKDGGLFSKNSRSGSKDDKVLRVQLVTWPGYAPGLYYNEGADANTRSRYYKDYGFKVEFTREDDLINAMNAWLADEYDVIVQTADAYPLYTSIPDVMAFNPKAFIQTDWSRGGDAIIAKRGINSINDLRGKRVALAVPAPAQTMLITALESAGMTIDDVDVVKTTDNIAAAELFQSNDVDAAVVWSPFDIEATSKVPGSKILLTTVEQSHIIGDIMLAKESVMKEKKDMFNGFYEGWMKAVAEMKNAGNNEKAAKYLGEFLQLPLADAKGAMTTVHYASHGDNMDFFGLNKSYRGMQGADLYTKMNSKFVEMGDSEAPGPAWRNVINTVPIITADSKLKGAMYASEGAKTFTPPSPKAKTVTPLASKPVTISFNTGQYQLTENAKTLIDLQFAETAKSFANMRIRIEGNTDNVGSQAMNQKLSERRAKAVAQYLENTYKMDPNRFVIIGNGPNKPVPGCEGNQNETCKSKNRRTDFQLIPG
jgi:NitT/TauT family transport system substrate-binding protein